MREKRKCPTCKREYRWYYFRSAKNCTVCKKTLCSSIFGGECIVSLPNEPSDLCIYIYDEYRNPLCKACCQRIVEPLQMRLHIARENSSKVRIYSHSYKGKIPIICDQTTELICGSYYEDRDEPETILQTTAAYLGFDCIYDFKFTKSSSSRENTYTDNRGNERTSTYYVTEWGCSGIAAKLK